MKDARVIEAKKELGEMYENIFDKIKERIAQFRAIGESKDDRRIFMELAFCLLTPASKAKNAWETIKLLNETGLIYNGDEREIANYLNTVRFKNNKAKNIVMARSFFYKNREFDFNLLFDRFDNNENGFREWIVNNIRGMAYKEATHFLRNIGRSGELCILDRHILRNLKYYNVIAELPSSFTKSRYLTIERAMQEFSRLIDIPVTHLDLLLWYKETGEIFK